MSVTTCEQITASQSVHLEQVYFSQSTYENRHVDFIEDGFEQAFSTRKHFISKQGNRGHNKICISTSKTFVLVIREKEQSKVFNKIKKKKNLI